MKVLLLPAATAALLATPVFAQSPAVPVPEWAVETPKDAPALLTFGLVNAPQLGFACERKSGQVSVRFSLAKRLADHKEGPVWVDEAGLVGPWPATITYASGADSSALRGRIEAQSETGDSMAVGEISTEAPVLKTFGKTGAITLTAIGEAVSPTPAKRGVVRKFLRVCG